MTARFYVRETIDDLKTTARSARPEDVERLIYNMAGVADIHHLAEKGHSSMSTPAPPAAAKKTAAKTTYCVFLRTHSGIVPPNQGSSGPTFPGFDLVATSIQANSPTQAIDIYAHDHEKTVKKGDVYAAVAASKWTVIPITDVETQTVIKLGDAT